MTGMDLWQRRENVRMLRADIDDRARQALRFVKVGLTEGGYLSEVSIAMLMVELRREGILLMDASLTNGEQA